MKIGLVGYQGSGKTTLFTWLVDKKTDVDGKGVAQFRTWYALLRQ